MNRIAQYMLNNVGSCMDCMRQSFQLAAMSWSLTFVLIILANPNLGQFGLALSVGLSLLWLTHLIVFAARNSAVADLGSGSAIYLELLRQNFSYAVLETAVLYRPGVRDRFGLPLLGRRFLVELENPDGSRTAYLKNMNDVSALVAELHRRGFTGDAIDPDYWMSTDSCERSAASKCKDHTCDSTTKTCKSGSLNGACRCQ